MHIKEQPDDFRVEELTNVRSSSSGDFALYRLKKRGWTTPDALAIARKRWTLDPRRMSFGGLKDRHADTTQYFTIYRGPQLKLTHANLHVAYLGQVDDAYESKHIESNRFAV